MTDAQDGFAYGLSSFQIINRIGQIGKKRDRKYATLPIEEKESYRWLKAANGRSPMSLALSGNTWEPTLISLNFL